MFRSQLFDHLQGVVFRAQCCYCFSVCLRRLFGMWLYVVYVCACLMYFSVGCLVVSSQPNIPQTSISGTHTHRQHTATYQINNFTTQTSREGSNSTKHERRPPEDGQTIMTETCRVLMMCFTNIFKIKCFKCKCECVLKRVHELVCIK